MIRVGLLSIIVAVLTNILLDHVPMTFDTGVWYGLLLDLRLRS